MKRIVWCIVILVVATAAAADTHLTLYDLQTGATWDLTGFLEDLSGIDVITGVTAVNTGSGEGDELLVVAGDSRVAILDAVRMVRLAWISMDDFRAMFGLPPGDGWFAGLTPPGHTVDELLYHDAATDDMMVFDFANNDVHPYTGPGLPDGFVTGFSYTSLTDIGVFNMADSGDWFYESLDGADPVALDVDMLFDGEPSRMTEYEIATTGMVYRFLLAVIPGEAPDPTPTPSPSPGPGTAFDTVIAMGLGENLWTVDGANYSTSENVDLTGAAPNQIVVRGDHFYVVNSRSNSLGIYSCATFRKTGEISLGAGRNPFNVAFSDDNTCFVTNFQANTVSRVNIGAGAVETEIPMPGSLDLPHDPGVTTYARPEGLVIVDGVCYVACGNLDDQFVAGGPGVIAVIDIAAGSLSGWFETMGRDTVSLAVDSRWPERLWVVNAGNYLPGQGYAGDGNINVYDMNQSLFTDTIPVHDAPFEIAFGADRAYLASALDGTVIRIDPWSLSLLSSVALPGAGQGLNFVSGLGVGPDGLLWVLEFNHDMLYLLDPGNDDTRIHDIPVGWGPDALAFIPRKEF